MSPLHKISARKDERLLLTSKASPTIEVRQEIQAMLQVGCQPEKTASVSTLLPMIQEALQVYSPENNTYQSYELLMNF